MAEIFVFGDSIGYGATDEEGGWPDRLKKKLHRDKLAGGELHELYNLSIDGDTSEDVAERIGNELAARRKPWSTDKDIVVIAVGANDAGAYDLPDNYRATPEQYRENLHKIVEAINTFGLRIIVVGLAAGDDSRTMPCEWGLYYTNNKRRKLFDRVGKEFCDKEHLRRIDLFEGSRSEEYINFLYDGLHPRTEGHQWLYQKIAPVILEMIYQS